jgi:hypothetical protein
MAKGFGIAALVLAILAIFIPVGGVAISAIAVLCAAVAGLAGDLGFSIATAIIAGVNTFFLSPSLWIMQEGGPSQQRSPLVMMITLAFVAIPIICAIIGANRKKSNSPA